MPISRLNEDQLAAFRQQHLGFVFQSYNLLPNLTATENVALPLMFRGVPKAQREAAARKLLTRVGLAHRLDHFPRQMSGGQQQRAGIARAFIARPDVVFAAEGSNLYITGYRVTNSAGTTVYSITKGSVVDITVSIKDTGDGTGQNDPKALDITKLDDSFTGGVLFVEKTSAPDAPLVYAVHLTGLTYKGVGQNLKLQVGTAGQPDSYQTLELTITEAVVYEAPQPTPEPVPTPPEPIPAPTVLVSRSALDKPIEAGQSIPVTVTFENLSRTRLTSPVVTFTPTDGISIAGGSSSFPLPDIAGKKSVSLTVTIQASSTIPSPAQSLGVDLKFNYFNNVSTVQGTNTFFYKAIGPGGDQA